MSWLGWPRSNAGDGEICSAHRAAWLARNQAPMPEKLEVGHRAEDKDWRVHDGTEMPVDPRSMVEIRYRNGICAVAKAGQRRWIGWPDEIGESGWDIVAWRFTETTSSPPNWAVHA